MLKLLKEKKTIYPLYNTKFNITYLAHLSCKMHLTT